MTPKTDTPDPACSEIQERIPLFIGGDLDLEVLECVSEHLQRCPSCAAACEQARRGREALIATLRQRESDYRKPNLWTGVRAGLAEQGRLSKKTPSEHSGLPHAILAALPSSGPPVASHAQPDPVPQSQTADSRSGSLLRRASGWVGLAAAACALYFLWPDVSGDQGLSPVGPGGSVAENTSPAPMIETLPAPTNFLAGNPGSANPNSANANTIPVSFQPLRKVQLGEKCLSEGAELLRTRTRSDAPREIVPGETMLTGYQ